MANWLNLLLKCKIFFQKIEVGSLELENGLKKRVSGAKKWPEKGVLKVVHPLTTLQCDCQCKWHLFNLSINVDLKDDRQWYSLKISP